METDEQSLHHKLLTQLTLKYKVLVDLSKRVSVWDSKSSKFVECYQTVLGSIVTV